MNNEIAQTFVPRKSRTWDGAYSPYHNIYSKRYCDLYINVLIFAYRYNAIKAENIKHSYKYMKKTKT